MYQTMTRVESSPDSIASCNLQHLQSQIMSCLYGYAEAPMLARDREGDEYRGTHTAFLPCRDHHHSSDNNAWASQGVCSARPGAPVAQLACTYTSKAVHANERHNRHWHISRCTGLATMICLKVADPTGCKIGLLGCSTSLHVLTLI